MNFATKNVRNYNLSDQCLEAQQYPQNNCKLSLMLIEKLMRIQNENKTKTSSDMFVIQYFNIYEAYYKHEHKEPYLLKSPHLHTIKPSLDPISASIFAIGNIEKYKQMKP